MPPMGNNGIKPTQPSTPIPTPRVKPDGTGDPDAVIAAQQAAHEQRKAQNG